MKKKQLTLSELARRPQLLTAEVLFGDEQKAVFRPLEAKDVKVLAKFLAGLSAETRRFATFGSYDEKKAREFCEAIAKYDKLRLVVEARGEIIGLFELSFDVVAEEVERYKKYGIELNGEADCRFGPTVADKYQNLGLGSAVFPGVVAAARRFGQRRMILWGGVLKKNKRGIHFYQKMGFRQLGEFINDDGNLCEEMILEIGDHMSKEVIAPCGMNCGLCLMYLREENSCPGCSSGRKVNGRCIKCGIKLCKERKGEYCFECGSYPCERLERLDKRYRERYGMSEMENLETIKKKGIECLLDLEEKKWVSKEGVYCVHDGKRYRRRAFRFVREL